MIPVRQRRENDCFVACLASLFECEVSDLPYIRPNPECWQKDWNAYLSQYNIKLVVSIQKKYRRSKKFLIGVVKNPNNKQSYHSVIVCRGKVVHDPSPNQYAYRCRVLHWILIKPVDARKPKRSDRLSSRHKHYKRGRVDPRTTMKK